MAALYYYNFFTLHNNWKDITDLKPQLIGFEHWMKAEEYDVAANLLKKIDQYLLLWVDCQSIVEKLESLKGKIKNPQLEMFRLDCLGKTYRNMSQYEKAIRFHKQALSIAKDYKNQQYGGSVYGNIGICYSGLGNIDKAIYYYQNALKIASENKDATLKAKWYNNLGICCFEIGKMNQAISNYNQGLEIARKYQDQKTIAECLNNLCNCYSVKGQYKIAYKHGEQALIIQEKINDLIGKSTTRHSIAEIFIDNKLYNEAIEFAEEGVRISKDIGNKRLQSFNQTILACAYLYSGSHNLTNAWNSITIAEQFNIPENNCYVYLLKGLISRINGNEEDTYKAFEMSLEHGKKLLTKNKHNYKALYVISLVLYGLHLWRKEDYLSTAQKFLCKALMINNDYGTKKRFGSLLQFIRKKHL